MGEDRSLLEHCHFLGTLGALASADLRVQIHLQQGFLHCMVGGGHNLDLVYSTHRGLLPAHWREEAIQGYLASRTARKT